MTGADFKREFERKIDKAYTDFYDNVKLRQIFRQAIVETSEHLYEQLSEQKQYDELRFLNITNLPLNVNNNRIVIAPVAIINIVAVGTTVTATTASPHNMVPGESFSIEDTQGTFATLPALNSGTLTVSSIPSPTSFTFTVTVFAGSYTPGTGSVTYAEMLDNYLHLFTIRTRFTSLTNYTVTGATSATPVVVTVAQQNNLRSTEQLQIAGVLGNLAANGTFFIRSVSANSFALYTDQKLLIPVSGTGAYTSGGAIARVTEQYATPYFSDRKTSPWGEPTVNEPKVETADGMLKIYPETETCASVHIDYMANRLVDIDPADTLIDLELYYPIKFLYDVLETATENFSAEVRDTERFQTAITEQQRNP